MRRATLLITATILAVFALCVCSAAWAQATTPAEAVADTVATSGAFPQGTTAVSVIVDGASAVVELSAEAVLGGLGDAQADAMVQAITNTLGQWDEIKSVEVTVAGMPLWQYLPPSSAPEMGGIGIMSAAVAPASTSPMAAVGSLAATSELAGKKIALHPSHGSYVDNNGSKAWLRAQRTLTGPNPATNLPPGWTGSRFTPSDYYYWTKKFQWGSFYEDDMSPETIRLLKKYLEAAGATVFVSRDLDKNSGNFNAAQYGYPNASFPLPNWQVAAKYYLQSLGLPSWIWNEPTLTADYDKDIRAKPYYANYVGADLSFSLHSNAFGVGQARGTETYWYTSKYPALQPASTRLATLVQNSVVTTMSSYFDDGYGKTAYPNTGSNPPEWPSGTYAGYTSWANRGVKTTNFGEIREAQMPSCLCEVAFHDDWKFYPDNLFMQDKIWRATIAWGFYESICTFFNTTPKQRLSAATVSSSFPTVVGPNKAFTGSVTMQNNGMIWCWGNKWASGVYQPYTLWYLKATGTSDPFTTSTMIPVDTNDLIGPGETETFSIPMTSPAVGGLYTTSWRMNKNDAKGGSFGDTVTTQIRVDAAGPEITIASPSAADYPYGPVLAQFNATDDYSGVASITADVDGQPVTDGQTLANLALGSHTLTINATDGVGNSSSKSVAFKIVDVTPPTITIASPTASDYPYGPVSAQFGATDELTGVASLTGNIDGKPVINGEAVVGLALGSHTLTVTAVDGAGNTATQSVTFNVVNTAGKVTVGGWIELQNKKGTCGFSAEYVTGSAAPTGSVTYQDHDTGMTVNSTAVVAIGVVGNKASIYGTCTIEGEAGHWFRIDVVDNGEPGNTDTFTISLDTGYTAGGTLGGGNVTIH